MSKIKVAHVIKGMGLGGVTPIVQQLMALLPRARVVSLLENPGCAAALAEKGRARARVFSWDATGSQLEAVYAKVPASNQAR